MDVFHFLVWIWGIMKKKIIIIAVFLLGLGIFLYPTLSDIIMKIKQQSIINDYNRQIEQLDEDRLQRLKEEAEEYNEDLKSGQLIDPFTEEEDISNDSTGYYSALDVGQEAMGYLDIPEININLPIYHGTSELVLTKGVGHLKGTSLPVGGDSTHCVLTGHTGLPTAKLFTDLDKMEIGDMFYIYILDVVLAYRVDQIKIVEPSDKSDLAIEEGKDYVTLVTCTPYGINTHRLFIRGVRTDYNPDEISTSAVNSNSTSVGSKKIDAVEFFNSYWMWIVILFAILVIIFIVIVILIRRKKSKGMNSKKGRKKID